MAFRSKISGALKQSATTRVAVDTTTTSTTFVTLLTVVMTTYAATSRLLVAASASPSATTNNRTISFRVTIDGVAQEACGNRCPISGEAQSGTVLVLSAVTAGSHTVLLEWLTSGGTAQIRPVGAPNSEGASMIVQELAD